MLSTARIHMVTNQLRPSNIHDSRILHAMGNMRREDFVPASRRHITYADSHVPVRTHPTQPSQTRWLLAPLVLARLVQESGVDTADTVLDVGPTTGYSTALLTKLAPLGKVVALENDLTLVEQETLHIDNILVEGSLSGGVPDHAPYDVILLNGAVREKPQVLCEQLGEGGRLVAVLPEGGVVFTRHGETCTKRFGFKISAPLLPDFS